MEKILLELFTMLRCMRIIIHYDFLRSLDSRNINNGVAEMIKKAALFDAKYFDELSEADLPFLVNNKQS